MHNPTGKIPHKKCVGEWISILIIGAAVWTSLLMFVQYKHIVPQIFQVIEYFLPTKHQDTSLWTEVWLMNGGEGVYFFSRFGEKRI